MYTQLLTKSAYSLLESTLTIGDYVEKAHELGYKKLGLSDHNVLHGAVEFYQLCTSKGIQPILGLTLDYFSPVINQEVSVYLIAKTYKGYQQLMTLSSKKMMGEQLQLSSPEELTDLFVVLPEINELMLAIEMNQEVDETIKKVAKAKNLFYQVSKHMLESENIHNIQETMEKMAIRPLAAEELKNAHEEDQLAIQVMKHISNGTLLSRDEMNHTHKKMTRLRSPVEVEKLYESFPEALENLESLVNHCSVNLKLNQSLLPKYPVPDGDDAVQLLFRLCQKGLSQRRLDQDDRYVTRLNYELQVIQQMGFVDYFLIVWDVMAYAHEHQVVTGAGRGSAAGSLVSYLLRITEVDPIEYDLLFERFLNPERYSMPDIDLDIPDNRREEILLYVKEKYGQNFVAQIATFGTMSAKMVLRDVARVFGLSQSESNRWSNAIPRKLKITLAESFEESKQLRDLISLNERNQLLFSVAKVLEGLPRHVSTHAAGVIISDINLWEIIPLLEGSNGIYLTQFTMKDVESIGLLKMDFLGLRNLSIIDDTLKGIAFLTNQQLTQEAIPLNDPKTMDLFRKGTTSGIFQFESTGIRNVLRKLEPDNLEDIAAVNALYRPGPMQMIDTFVNRKKGKEPIRYPDDSLKDILKSTYGVMVYQEQVMQVASKLAGFTLGEADLLRRAISKKNKVELDQQRAKFIDGTLRMGHSAQTANLVYDYIERFADYGFNRSHAFAYSIIGYQMAYLKTHYPVAFFRALLKSVQGNQTKVRDYVGDAQQYAISILPPSINKSYGGFTIESASILRFGLSSIKGIRSEFVKTILQNRKNGGNYQSFDQFLLRLNLENPKFLKEEPLILLIKVGVFDELDGNRKKLIQELEGKLQNLSFSAGSMDLLEMMPLKVTEMADYRLSEKLSFEEELLGLYLSGHPVQNYQEIQESYQTTFLNEFEEKKEVQVLGYIKSSREIRTKKGERMCFLEISDQTTEMTAVLFPEVYRKFRKELFVETVCLFEGKFEQSNFNGENQLIVRNCSPIDKVKVKTKPLVCYIRVTKENDQVTKMKELARLLAERPGQVPVVLYYEETGQQRKLQRELWLEDTISNREKLISLFNENNVIFK